MSEGFESLLLGSGDTVPSAMPFLNTAGSRHLTNELMIRISRLRLLELRTWNGYSVYGAVV